MVDESHLENYSLLVQIYSTVSALTCNQLFVPAVVPSVNTKATD